MFRSLFYRWHDWRHKDVPQVNQRVDLVDKLPHIPERERMRLKPWQHAKCRSLAEYIRKQQQRGA